MAKSFDLETTMIIILLLLLLIVTTIIIKKVKPQTPPLPPSPNPWPILSSISHFLHPLTHTSLATLSHSHGPLMHFHLGAHRLIVASSPAAAASILKSHDRALSARAAPHAVPLSPSQIARLSFWADPTSDNWRAARAICRAELFSEAALEAQAAARDAKAAEMVAALRAREGVETDVGRLVYATVVNVFSSAFFSVDFVGLDDEAGCERLRGFLRGIIGAISAPNLSDFLPFLGVFDLQGLRRKHREFSGKVWEMWRAVVEERRRDELRCADFLDKLISRGFDDQQINHLLEDLFTAGIDTTTSTITRTMMELIATPQSLTKLKQELDDSFPSSPIEALPYLQACVKETLRLHPPAPLMLSHHATEACRVMGRTVPRGARVQVNVWAIGRDPASWDDPLEYRPERFLGPDAVDFKGNDFEFLPFGAGRRICPGIPMAAKIVPLVVASLVYFFDWSSKIASVDHEHFRATSQMRGPLLLIPRARK